MLIMHIVLAIVTLGTVAYCATRQSNRPLLFLSSAGFVGTVASGFQLEAVLSPHGVAMLAVFTVLYVAGFIKALGRRTFNGRA